MTCIISHSAKESVRVFVGDPLKLCDSEMENICRLGKDVGDRRRV